MRLCVFSKATASLQCSDVSHRTEKGGMLCLLIQKTYYRVQLSPSQAFHLFTGHFYVNTSPTHNNMPASSLCILSPSWLPRLQPCRNDSSFWYSHLIISKTFPLTLYLICPFFCIITFASLPTISDPINITSDLLQKKLTNLDASHPVLCSPPDATPCWFIQNST